MTIISKQLAAAAAGALDNKRPGWGSLYVSLHTEIDAVTESVFRASELSGHSSYARQRLRTSNAAISDTVAHTPQASDLTITDGLLTHSTRLRFTVDVSSSDVIRSYGVWKGDGGDVAEDFLFGANLSAPIPASRSITIDLEAGTIVLSVRVP